MYLPCRGFWSFSETGHTQHKNLHKFTHAGGWGRAPVTLFVLMVTSSNVYSLGLCQHSDDFCIQVRHGVHVAGVGAEVPK